MARNGTLAKSQELQPSFQTTTEQITIGIDLGDRFSHCCVLGPAPADATISLLHLKLIPPQDRNYSAGG
jgi:hypothetical protein